MKAIRVHSWNQQPRLEDLPDPSRAPGRTLVRMAAATVGHIDRTVWGGQFMNPPALPYVPGVEAAGVVLESEVFAPGERVWIRGTGLDTRFDGTWREIIDAPDAAIGRLPEGVPMSLGSAFFSPSTSAWVALHEVAKVRAGERVLVSGASGAVGSLAMQLARDAGAEAIAWKADDAASGSKADVLIDTVGGPVLAAALERIEAGGRAVLVGYTAGNEIAIDIARFLQRDVSLLPLNMFRRDAAGRAAAPELLARLADGRLQLQVTEFALADAALAMQWITQRGHRGRAVLVP
ncbi:zinc-binding alcohol dehydrogenase family protein [Variovorax sp. OV329]|uniref:quinone oxidoreductase family protein n=1 Tax=Variovorax sp. OV329 TaxID=1882825 RepID=UPI0008F2BFC4|nr:zinc-binding alcohol dehydrogenase family protein [Variovorax sp. OV329]SFN15179.1 NADPH2:quinone reductase [Variovorax sp. OV329]